MALESCPLALAAPSAIAIAPSLTYGELDLLVKKGAASLKIQGFKRGDLIAIQGKPDWQTIALLFASWRLGLCAAIIPSNLPPLSNITPLFAKTPSDPFAKRELFLESALDMEKNAVMLLTSGSSGSPKWASFSLSELFESARTVAAALGAKKESRWLLSIPLYHVGGLGVALRGLLTEGVLFFENKSLSYNERILSAAPDFASLVPTQLYRLLRDEMPPPKTHFLIGGAPLAKELYEKASSLGYRLSLTYGLTEMSSTVLLTDRPKWIDSFAYLGNPLPNRTISLSSEGEILVSGASLFNGYGFPPGSPPSPFPTGDLGAFHPEFGWSVQGRRDFQFFSGGENIRPEEIEAAMLSHPDVEEAIVVPKPDVEFGARPAAFIRTSLSEKELIAYLFERLPKYKIPILFQRLEEGISLKPNRKELIQKVMAL